MATAAPTITGVDFVTVSATDFPASVHFYGEVLGLPQTARYGSRDGAAREIALDEDALLPLLNAVAGHHGPLEGRRLETPEAVALHWANTLDARVAEAL